MEMVIEFIKWFFIESDKFFPYGNRQREDFYDACGEYYEAILIGLYPEYSQYIIDNIIEDIHNYIDEGRSTEDIANLIRATYSLENREKQLDEVLKEWSECDDREEWRRNRADKNVSIRRDAALKLLEAR